MTASTYTAISPRLAEGRRRILEAREALDPLTHVVSAVCLYAGELLNGPIPWPVPRRRRPRVCPRDA
jgi:hypothetical protein